MRWETLPLHDEGDIAVLLAKHQGSQLLRQQVDVVDLRHGGQWTQRVTVTHGGRLPGSHLDNKGINTSDPKKIRQSLMKTRGTTGVTVQLVTLLTADVF